MVCYPLEHPLLTYSTYYAWYLGSDGYLYGSYCTYTYGSRPAFLLPSNYVVEPKSNLVDYTTRELVEELFNRADK